MDSSITQELNQELEKLMEMILGFNITRGITPEYEKITDAVKEFLRCYAETQLRELDAVILENRPKEWEVVKANQERELESDIGLLKYKRRYYRHKETKSYAHLTDLVAQIEKGSKVDIGLVIKLVEYAGDNSYAKSSKLACNGRVSKQSVMKFARRAHDYELDEPEPRPGVKEVHIQADEDHVSMQTGESTIVKVITVHEPTKKIKKRSYLPEKRQFVSYSEKPEDFWDRVLDYICERYDKDIKVYIHGDGALWIKAGLGIIPGSVHILDRYHLYKRVHQLSKGNWLYECQIFQYLRHKKVHDLKVFLETIVANDELDEGLAEENYKYLRNNKDGIWNTLKLPYRITKSCAEGQVSHVLSDRLSSRPKAWMPKGLESIPQLRVYGLNGGVLKPEHFRLKNKTLEFHKGKIEQLRKRHAPHLCHHNLNITKSMPKASNNKFLKDISRGLIGYYVDAI